MPSKAEEIQEKIFEFSSRTFYSSLFRTVFFSQSSKFTNYGSLNTVETTFMANTILKNGEVKKVPEKQAECL